jgi:hypothetical protein
LEAYALYRKLELHIRITLNEHGSILPVQASLETLARCAARTRGPELAARVASIMSSVRARFLEIAGRLASHTPDQ